MEAAGAAGWRVDRPVGSEPAGQGDEAMIGGDDDPPDARLAESCDEIAQQVEHCVELCPGRVEHARLAGRVQLLGADEQEVGVTKCALQLLLPLASDDLQCAIENLVAVGSSQAGDSVS